MSSTTKWSAGGVHVQWGTAYPRVRATTFTQSNWNVPQTVYIWGWGDHDDDDDTERVRHHASGGGYDGVVKNATAYIGEKDSSSFPGATPTPTPTPAATPIPTPTPGASPGLVLTDTATGDPATGVRVPQGGSGSFDIRLNTTPSANVPVSVYELYDGLGTISYSPQTVTFTPDNWNASQTVTVYSSNSPDRRQNKGTLLIRTGHTDDTTGYYNMPWTYFNVYEDDRRGFIVSPAPGIPVNINEGETHTYTIKLGTQPTADVTVNIARATGGDTDITVSPASLTFTTANYSTAQTVTISAAKDDSELETATATITHSVATADSIYAEQVLHDINVTAANTTIAQFILTNNNGNFISALTAPEGSSPAYKVELLHRPLGNVTVTIAEGTANDDDTDITVTSSKTLTFNTGDWKIAKTVTLNAARDADALAGSRSITHTATGGGYDNASMTLLVTEQDEDAAIIILGNAITTLYVQESGSATYNVKLGATPSSNVTVALSATGGDDDIAFAPSSLTFTPANHSTAQTVTVSAAADADNDRGTKTIIHTATSADANYHGKSASLIAIEKEPLDLVEPPATVREGGSSGYVVLLAQAPSSDVTVSIVATTGGTNDADITVSPTSFTFTPDFYWQLVTISAARDADTTNGVREINHIVNGDGYSNVNAAVLTVTEADDGVAISLSPTELSVTEGGDATYTVELSGSKAPTADVTVALTAATGGDTDITFSPASLTFTPTNYTTAQTVTVSADTDADTTNGTKTINHTATSTDASYNGRTASIVATESDNGVNTNSVGANSGPTTSERKDPTPTPTPTATPIPTPEPTPPAAVGSVLVSRSDGKVFASWNGADGADGYNVVYSTDGKNSWTRAATNHAGTSYTITGANNADSYVVAVQSVNAAGSSGWVNSASAPALESQELGAVAGVHAVHNGDSIHATWTPADNAIGYDVVYSNDNAISWTRAATNRAGTSITIAGADKSKNYIVAVRALSADDASGWTNSPAAAFTPDDGATITTTPES